MAYNYSRLRGRIRECGLTQADIAKAANIQPATLNLKLRGKAEFKQSEMYAILEYLNIPLTEIESYFFNA